MKSIGYSRGCRFFLTTLFFLLVVNNFCFAQPLYGVVKDSITNTPIAGASVFINNTTFGTICNEKGEFVLSKYPAGDFALTVSAISFQFAQVSIRASAIPAKIIIALIPKVKVLDEVVVLAQRKDGWEKYGARFLQNFIGTSTFAGEVVLKNKKDLKFYFANGTLSVKSDKPLTIINKALGYEITYWMEEYTESFNERTVFKSGVAVFNPLKGNKKKQAVWSRNRESAYLGSLNHFISSLYRGNSTAEGFEIRILKRISIEEYKQHIPVKRDTAFSNSVKFSALLDSIKQNTVGIAEKIQERIAVWLKDTTNKPFKFTFMRKGEKVHYEFTKDEFIKDKIITQSYSIPDSINPGNGVLNVLYDKQIVADSFINKIGADSKQLAFNDYWYVTYTKELEENEYKLENFPFRKQSNTYQTSVITLLNPNGIFIFNDGNFREVNELLVEKYWAWERLDKLMPLDYERIK